MKGWQTNGDRLNNPITPKICLYPAKLLFLICYGENGISAIQLMIITHFIPTQDILVLYRANKEEVWLGGQYYEAHDLDTRVWV